jgi:hypothetical protein
VERISLIGRECVCAKAAGVEENVRFEG